MTKEPEGGKLPSNTIPNLKVQYESTNAVTLRSGRVIEGTSKGNRNVNEDLEKEENLKNGKSDSTTSRIETDLAIPDPVTSRIETSLQSPTESKGKTSTSSIPRKFKGNEVVALSEEVSSILQRRLPPKLKDPGRFTIPCTIGVKRFDKALLNLMPLSVFSALNLGTLKRTSVVIELVDRSSVHLLGVIEDVHPLGVIEDVLVRVDGLVLLAEFFVIDMEETSSLTSLPLILRCPFMATAHTNINVYKHY
ncbi:uncharacterized protein LOC112194621 [Rosa chinensis]|uniref:uncharacterized protein LOC112194621 n=1 Tax=Rosa chinensis TaxID=74649 RepID=UPI001AD8FBE2|nr:uncharacterized protein LOC112194621 [Rosa chinensis]